MVVLLSVNSEGSSDLQGSGREKKDLSLTELSESQRQPNLLIAGEGPAINNQSSPPQVAEAIYLKKKVLLRALCVVKRPQEAGERQSVSL